MKKQNRTILEKEFNETVEKLKQIAQATSQAIAKSTYEIQNGVDLSKTQETNKTQKTAQKTNGAGSITNFSNLLPKKGGN
jgi:LysM repeat protein